MADQTTKQPQMTPEEAVKIIYLAKYAGSERTFLNFQEDLRKGNIPWSFTNKRFLERIKELKQTLIAELNLQNEELATKAAEESFSHALSQEEREGMMKGISQIHEQEIAHRQNLFKHTDALVDTYINQLKKQVMLSPEEETAVRKSVSQATRQTLEQGNVSDLEEQIALASSQTNVPHEAASVAAASLELPAEAQESSDKIDQLSEITKVVFNEPSVHAGAFIEKCFINPEIDPEIIASKNSEELQELQVAKILSLPEEIKQKINETLESPTDQHKALRQAVGSAGQLPDEVVRAVWGKNGKEFIDDAIGWITGDSLKKTKEKAVADGKPIDAEKLKLIEQWVAQREAIRKTSKTFFNQALFESAAIAWGPKIKTGLMVYLETVTFKASINAPAYFHYFILAGTDVWNAILGRSTKLAASEATKKAAGALLGEGEKKAAAAAGLTAAKAGVGIFGGPIGTFLALAGDKVVSFVWGGIKGLFSFLGFSEIAKGLTQGLGVPAQKKPWWKDMSWILPIACVAGIFVLSGFTFLRETTTTAAIVGSKEKTGGEEVQNTGRGFPHGDPEADTYWNDAVNRAKNIQRKTIVPSNYCDSNPKALICTMTVCPIDECNWPTLNGKIIQGPGGSYSHGNGLNAVDIGGLQLHDPIFALNKLVGGVVLSSSWLNKYADGSAYPGNPDGGYYGNYIDIKTLEGFTVRIGHLAYGNSPTVGTTIKAGQKIGLVGETGSSDGPHIHIEVRSGTGGPNILSLLPGDAAKVPVGCDRFTSCGSVSFDERP